MSNSDMALGVITSEFTPSAVFRIPVGNNDSLGKSVAQMLAEHLKYGV